MRCRSRDERGSITAEFAIVIPAVLLVLAACVGAIQISSHQVRLSDAAADAARSLARGDSAALASERVRQLAGDARLASNRTGDFVCVELDAPVALPIASHLGVTITASSCALAGGL